MGDNESSTIKTKFRLPKVKKDHQKILRNGTLLFPFREKAQIAMDR